MMVRVCVGLTLTAMIAMYQRQLMHYVVTDAAWFLVLPIILACGALLLRRIRWTRPAIRLAPSEPLPEPEAERVPQRV
jgi:hypothetical protein